MSTFNGTYSQLKEEREKEAARRTVEQTAAVPDSRRENIEVRRAKSKETKEERRKIAQLHELENTIAELEAKLANLSTQLESPFVSPGEAAKLGTEYQRVQREMDEKLGEWERLQV
jgi:predicted RNase H-like nuclease (RuvC/YqgF family)